MSTEYTKLLMYFILVLGVILIGVQLLFFVEIHNAKTELQAASIKLNQTSAAVNQTQLFLSQQDHEDLAREKQTKIEQVGRSNQTRVLINNTSEMLENFFIRYNNTTQKMFLDIKNAQQQNQDIIDILFNISRNLEGNTSDTNTQVSKYGPENNALGRAILQEMGINASEIIERDVYSNQTLKKMILP